MNQDRINTSLDNKSLFKMLAVPMIIMQIFSGLMQLGDRIISAVFIGEEALSAVSLIFPVLSLGIAIAVMLMAGLGIEINYLLGKKEREKAGNLASFVLSVSVIVSVLLMLVFVIFNDAFINLIVPSDRFRDLSSKYLTFVALSFPGMAIGFTLSTVITADGGAKYNMIGQMILSVGNILLNALFVIVFDMGILGIGLGTVIASGLFLTYNLMYFILGKTISFSFGKYKVDFKELGKVIYNGSSEFFSIFAQGIMMLVINAVILTVLSEDFYIAYSMVGLFVAIYINTFFGGVFGITPVISKAYGEGDVKRGKSILRYSYLRTIVIGFSIYLLTILLVKPVSNIITDSQYIVDTTFMLYMTLGLSYMLTINSIFMSGYLSAMKKPGLSLIISTIKPLLLTAPILTYTITLFLENGLLIGTVIVELLIIPLMLILYKSVK